MADGGSVLVNFVYCHPVGHMIEALHYCHGYHRADPGLSIGLAVNADTPAELAARALFGPALSSAQQRLQDALAAVAACDVLVAPHSGFGMAALAVGTPWLSIAGNLWPEYYFNGVPFYSVLPDVRRFPAYPGLGPEPEPVDDDGPRSPSMCRERIEADLDEITEGAARLIERRWPAEEALADHVARMLAVRDGRTDRIWSVDSVHRKYLNQQN